MRKKAPRKLRGQMNTCEDETALIGDYLSSNLTPRVTAAFEKHLQVCPDCAAFLSTYKKTIEVTRAFLKAQPVRLHEPALRRLAGAAPGDKDRPASFVPNAHPIN